MKKFLLLISLMALMLGTTAQAAPSGYFFEAASMGVRINVDDQWMDTVNNQRLMMLPRGDESVRTDQLFGYSILYMMPEAAGMSFQTYDALEAWLEENALALGGVISHKAGADVSAIRPEYERMEMGSEGETVFTAIRPASIDASSFTPELQTVAQSVYSALSAPSSYQFFDASQNYGLLGAFDTTTLNGEAINQDFVRNAKLTLVYFWGTYCSPCTSTMGELSQILEGYRDQGVQALGVVTDAFDEETREIAREIVEKTGVTFDNISPDLSPAVLGRVQYTPTYVFVDEKGEQVGEAIVGPMKKDQWAQEIESRLGA